MTTWRPLGDHWAFEEPTGPSEHSAGQYWPSGDPIGPFGLRLIWAIYRYLGRVLSIFGATFINFYAVELGELLLIVGASFINFWGEHFIGAFYQFLGRLL